MMLLRACLAFHSLYAGRSIRAAVLMLGPGADAAPTFTWPPQDAVLKDYILSIEPESVAVAEGGRIRGMRPGLAKAEVITMDGG